MQIRRQRMDDGKLRALLTAVDCGSFSKAAAQLGYTQSAMTHLVNKLEAEPNGDVSRLLPEMLRVVAFQTLTNMGESDASVGAMDVMLLAKALKDIAGTQKTNIDTELLMRKVRAETQAKADAAAAEVEAITRNAGMSEELVSSIRARILGVGDQA